MTFIGLATLIYLVIYKVDANSTISEITFSPFKEIDISSGPVSVTLSFEFTMGAASTIDDIEVWYGGGNDLHNFACLSQVGFIALHKESKLFGPGPYEASETRCASLKSYQKEIAPDTLVYCFGDIAAGKMAVRVEYSLQSLTSATNVWRAALLNLYASGSMIVRSTPPAVTTVGVLTRNLIVSTSIAPDGSIMMNFKCTIGPVIPNIELILTLPPCAETGPTKGNNSVSIQIPYNENLDGATITCEAYIVHPRPTVLPETKDVEYAPMYLNNSLTIVCYIPCQLNLLCSLHLVAYPKAAVTFWWSPDMVANSSVISVNEPVTIECTATNPLGNAKRTIIAHVTKTDDPPTVHVHGNSIVWAVSIVPAAIFLVAIGVAIFLFSRWRKLKRHQENTSQETNNNQLSADEYRPLLEPEGRSEHDYDSLHWGGQGQAEDNQNHTIQQSSSNNSITRPETVVPFPIEPVLSAARGRPNLEMPTDEYQPLLESSDRSEHDYDDLYLLGQGQTEGHRNLTNQQSSPNNSISRPEATIPLPVEPFQSASRGHSDPRFPTSEYQPFLESADRSENDYNYPCSEGQGQEEGYRNQTNQQFSPNNSSSRPETVVPLPIEPVPRAVRENRFPTGEYQPLLESSDRSEHDHNYLYVLGQGQADGHRNQTNQQSSPNNSTTRPETVVPLPIEPAPSAARENRDPRFPYAYTGPSFFN